MIRGSDAQKYGALLKLVVGVAVLGGGLALAGARLEATEIIPSVGLTRAENGDETKTSAGLALRAPLIAPGLKVEIAGSYRTEEFADGALKTKVWPITASAIVAPLRVVHADAGAGWYNTTFEYRDPLLKDETEQDFGVHAGGGLTVPLAPAAGLDVTGRYVWMQDQKSKLIPSKFNPDFWTLSLGLVLKL